MNSEANQLHIFFFPLMAPGHTIPMIDIAKLFAERGVKVTIITTPSIGALIEKTIERANELFGQMEVSLLHFPTKEAGLPEGCDNWSFITSPEMIPLFFKAIEMLQEPVEQLLGDRRPNCIISDAFFPWTVEVADKFGIPTLLFHGTNYFYLCISNSLYRFKPHENVATETEAFLIPGLPHPIKITRAEMPSFVKCKGIFTSILDRARQSEIKSYGVVVNSFYELEQAYADHYKKEVKSKAWHIGPVSLCNRIIADKAERGNKASISQADCLRWLDTKKPGSVIYVCFGSMCRFGSQQLVELALGLEASKHDFIWVVREEVLNMEKENEWLPRGIEERLNGKSLIIRGWAPQIAILDHPSIGGFVTHCGWNSVLESLSAGVPMIAWPLYAEQFYNEKLITQVLEIGIVIGVGVCVVREEERELVMRETVEKAVARLMGGGEEADGMKKRVKELGEMARKAVEKGGSSYSDMDRLIEELMMCSRQGEKKPPGKGCVLSDPQLER